MPLSQNPANLTAPLLLTGAALAWDDLRIEPSVRTGGGANAPTFEVWDTNGAGSRGIFLYSFDNASAGNEKEMQFRMQMPHTWDGTAVSFHVHWKPNTSENAAVRWGLEYTWSGVGQTFSTTTLAYGAAHTPVESLVAKRHYLTPIATLTPGAGQVGASVVLIGRVFRDSANAADTYTDKVGLLSIDLHYRLNKLGDVSV
jgi:hypothetical protein